MDICPGAPSGFISSVTNYVDCQAQLLGSGAWQALAAPGSTLTILLTGFLTICIALIGYNLLLGHSMTVRSGTLAFVKMGAVLALATSWPAYRTLVYDLVTDGPGQLVREIGPGGRIPGSDGTLTERLDFADQALAQLAILGPGNPPAASAAQIPPPPFGGFDAFAIGGSRIIFDLTAIAGLGVVRIISGLMLALGPFFIAFLLFDSTRSLFEGWVRVLAGTAVAGVGVAIALGLELALVEPWLGNVLARRMAGEALPTVSTELFVIACLFSIIVLAMLYACQRTTRAFRLTPLLTVHAKTADQKILGRASDASHGAASNESSAGNRSRAAAIAGVLTAASRREQQLHIVAGTAAAPLAPGRTPPASAWNGAAPGVTPVGRTFTRRAHGRLSATAARRDAGA